LGREQVQAVPRARRRLDDFLDVLFLVIEQVEDALLVELVVFLRLARRGRLQPVQSQRVCLLCATALRKLAEGGERGLHHTALEQVHLSQDARAALISAVSGVLARHLEGALVALSLEHQVRADAEPRLRRGVAGRAAQPLGLFLRLFAEQLEALGDFRQLDQRQVVADLLAAQVVVVEVVHLEVVVDVGHLEDAELLRVGREVVAVQLLEADDRGGLFAQTDHFVRRQLVHVQLALFLRVDLAQLLDEEAVHVAVDQVFLEELGLLEVGLELLLHELQDLVWS
jgi:hypothetical protein